MKDRIKLFIADDHPIFRDGLKTHLEKDARFEIIGEASDGREAIEKLSRLTAEIAILDIDMPGADGFEVARKIQENNLPTKIIFLTIHKDEHTLNKALDMNVKGYLVKENAVTDVINCIRYVSEDQVFISPVISGFLLKRIRRTEKAKDNKELLKSLTATEHRILILISDYKTSREIGDELFISFRTVENHRANIARKLDLTGSHALIKYAIENKSLLS